MRDFDQKLKDDPAVKSDFAIYTYKGLHVIAFITDVKVIDDLPHYQIYLQLFGLREVFNRHQLDLFYGLKNKLFHKDVPTLLSQYMFLKGSCQNHIGSASSADLMQKTSFIHYLFLPLKRFYSSLKRALKAW